MKRDDDSSKNGDNDLTEEWWDRILEVEMRKPGYDVWSEIVRGMIHKKISEVEIRNVVIFLIAQFNLKRGEVEADQLLKFELWSAKIKPLDEKVELDTGIMPRLAGTIQRNIFDRWMALRVVRVACYLYDL